MKVLPSQVYHLENTLFTMKSAVPSVNFLLAMDFLVLNSIYDLEDLHDGH